MLVKPTFEQMWIGDPMLAKRRGPCTSFFQDTNAVMPLRPAISLTPKPSSHHWCVLYWQRIWSNATAASGDGWGGDKKEVHVRASLMSPVWANMYICDHEREYCILLDTSNYV